MVKRISIIAAVALAMVSCAEGGKKVSKLETVFTPTDEILEAPATITSGETLTDSPNQWIAFRKDFTLKNVPKSVPAKIAVDSKYWLWINGELAVFEGQLKRGPKRGESYFDEVDLAPYLKKGENKLALLLWYFGKDGFSHSSSGQAQLWFSSPSIGLQSDESWLCRVHPSYGKADCPEPNNRLSESSISFDARKDIEGWQTGSTDGFSPAKLLQGSLGTLHSRPIPFWKDFGIKEASFETHAGPGADTLVAKLPHNMQMTPVLCVEDQEGGHKILIETDHALVGEECLRAEYITKAGTQEYESLGWLNGMRIILTVPHGAKVTAIKYRETGYDTAPEGKFTCEDPFYNKFWEKGLRTIYVNARDNFFDCPDRERAQWWGDIVTILGESFYTYTPSLHALIRKGIRELCDWQKPDGRLYSPIPGNYGAELPCQMLAAVGVYGFWTYYMNTGDRATIEYVLPAIKEYLETYHVGEDGLLEWHEGEWNWGDWGYNKDMRLLQNMWYVMALQSVTNMEDMLGEIVTGRVYRGRMNDLIAAINRVAWTGTCYRHPDYKGETDDRVNALAVVAGVAWKDKYDAIYEVLKKEEHASPYMEKYVMEALFCIGHGDYALERERKRYDFIVNHPDFDTLFEGWNVGINGDWSCGSVNHAWSGGPLAVLPAKMFGIAPILPGWKRFSIEPDEHIFNDCSLSFPTVKGTVSVAFKRNGKALHMDLEVPEGSLAQVKIPWADYIRNLGPGKYSLDLGNGPVFEAGNFPYRDKDLPVEKRVEDLLSRMSLEEKVCQVSAELVSVEDWDKRDYTKGLVRTVSHFLHSRNLPDDPKSVAEVINEDTRLSILANRWGIPVLQHCEALHGAMWGRPATSFPQSIAMAASFDDEFYNRVAQVIAEEVRAVGVRQVLSPVVNLSRDPRWGRTQEGYGEDVLLNSAMGVAFVKALEEGGIVTTPKHYVDNYGEGGRDSYASTNSWRVLREVFLEPFRACVEEGGARGIMSSYNSVDGVPASCNSVLLNDILKKEWGFKGIVVTDYDAVDIVRRHHGLAETEDDALALCMENGLDVELHITSLGLLGLVEDGKLSEKTLDEAVRRVLRLKFELGLFDDPYVDPDKAASVVRTEEHKELAYEAGCKVMTLLKNDGILPLKPGSVRRIGVFGPAADDLSLGGYRRPGDRWEGDGVTPLEGLRKAFEGSAQVVLNTGGQNVKPFASTCDVLFYFPSIIEDEGSDRSSFLLPAAKVRDRDLMGGLIVDAQQRTLITIDQEKMVRDLIATGKPVIVVLQNGGIIDITDWVDDAAAVLEAWYPGEQGGRAIADVVTGKRNPGGRLPISWSKSIGQTPMYYAIKPSGRAYGYVDNDGKPLYPFGYGLSYTTFEYSDFQLPATLASGDTLKLSVRVKNTGEVEGDEVVQVYSHDILASVVRPFKELVAFKRVTLAPGESKVVELEVPYRRFSMWDKDMVQRVEEGTFEVWLGRDADNKVCGGKVEVAGGSI